MRYPGLCWTAARLPSRILRSGARRARQSDTGEVGTQRARRMSLVEFRGVACAYGDRRVLSDVSLSLAQGEALALVGRSGAGKSTMLKLVNRMLVPQQGSVLVDGRDTREWDPIRLRR